MLGEGIYFSEAKNMLNINFMLKLKEDKNVSTFSSSLNLTLFSAMKSQKCHEFDLVNNIKIPTISPRDPKMLVT